MEICKNRGNLKKRLKVNKTKKNAQKTKKEKKSEKLSMTSQNIAKRDKT